MNIRRLQISRFRGIGSRRTIPFEDAMGKVRPVTVLAGPNGCGKTSVLYAVYRALSGALHYRSDDVPFPSEEEIHREGGAAGWSFDPGRAEVVLDLQYTPDELIAIPSVFAATRSLQKPKADGSAIAPPQLPDGQLTVEWRYPPDIYPDGTPKPISNLFSTPKGGATWLAGPGYAIKGWRNRPRPLVEAESLDSIGILRMFAQNRGKRWVAAEEREAFPADEEDATQSADMQRVERRRPTVSNILKVLAEMAQGRRPTGSPIEADFENRVRDNFAQICAPKRYVGYVYYGPNDELGTPLLQEGNRQYPLNMAATGEQVILDYLTQFVYPRPVNNSIVLIDEPELHLHPKWVRQLYRAFPKMGRGNQFIMSTHSSELRQLAAEDNALVDLGDLCDAQGAGAHA